MMDLSHTVILNNKKIILPRKITELLENFRLLSSKHNHILKNPLNIKVVAFSRISKRFPHVGFLVLKSVKMI